MAKSYHKEASREYFGKVASKYDNKDVYKMCKNDYPDIVEEIEKEPCIDILDCGCGTGAVITLLHESHPQMVFTGIDLAEPMIEVAQRRDLERATFLAGDCENLPFADSSFDAVICSHSFHHYPHPQDFFDSVARVLRPGGRLIIRDNTGSDRWLLKQNLIKIPYSNFRSHMGDVKFYSKREVKRFLDKAGLEMLLFEERKTHKMHCVARKPA